MARSFLILLAPLLFCSNLWAADPAKVLAAQIDARIMASIEPAKVTAAPRSSDEEYLRRIYLDLMGRIPSVAEVRTFLDDSDPDKRTYLVDRLIASPGYTAHAARQWRTLLVPGATNNPQTQYLGVSVEAWARDRLRAGLFDSALVAELLTARLDYLDWTADKKAIPGKGLSPVGFYQANDLKPETVGSAVGRTFLGLKLECALCHNHPFDKWTQKQAWETSAFFAGVAPLEPLIESKADLAKRKELKMADSETMVSARFLDGNEPSWNTTNDPRAAFAAWLTRKDNPYFAKVMVNRIWANCFGVGIVDPLDDWGAHNLPSHPELLEELAQAYTEGGFDPRPIIKAIVASETYQRTSRMSDPKQADPRLFARMNVKGLSAEQLFDSLALATGYRDLNPPTADLAFGWPARSPRGLFIAKFGGGAGRTDMQVSILQALSLMNGDFLANQTDPAQGEFIKAVAAAPFLDDGEKIETLFLATLSRRPTKPEKIKYLAHLKNGANAPRALGDLLWILVNCQEFLVNH